MKTKPKGDSMEFLRRKNSSENRRIAARWAVAAAALLAGAAHAEEPLVWDGATLVETSTGDASDLSKIAMDRSGTAIAVWTQREGRSFSVWSNRYVVGAGWENPTLLELAAATAIKPQVAMDGNGNAVAAWIQSDGVANSMWVARYVADVGWEAAEVIDDSSASTDFPRIAVDGNGVITALWKQLDGAVFSLWANRYVPGQGWGTPQSLESRPEDASEPWVAADPRGNGDALAVWRQAESGDESIWGSWYIEGIGWGEPFLLETSPGFASFPHVTIDQAGNALVAWYQAAGVRLRSIWSAYYTAGQGWGEPELAETNGGNAQGPEIAMDAFGRVTATWWQTDTARVRSIWANRYVPGFGWETATLLETGSGVADRPGVAVDDAGNAVVVWQQSDGGVNSVWSNHYVEGVGWGAPSLVETAADNAISPVVAADDVGNAVALWNQTDGTVRSMWANTARLAP